MRLWNNTTISINEHPIPIDKSPRYLGVYLDKHLSWLPHLKVMEKEVKERVNLLKRFSSTKHGLKTKQLRNIYQAFINPKLTYACPVWFQEVAGGNSAVYNRIWELESKAIRMIIGAPQSTPIISLNVEACVLPWGFNCDLHTARFAIRSIHDHKDEWHSMSDLSPETSPINQILSVIGSLNIIDTTSFKSLPPQYQTKPYGHDWTLPKLLESAYGNIILKWQHAWATNDTAKHHHQISPNVYLPTKPHHQAGLTRQQEVSITRCRLNHAFTNSYKHRIINPNHDPTCRFCGLEDETVEHLFTECSTILTSLASSRLALARFNHTQPDQLKIEDILGDYAMRKSHHFNPTLPKSSMPLISQVLNLITQQIHL